MKSLISEIVKIQLVRELLSEGRVEDAKAKFPQDADVIDYFVSQDPSGNNKYLNWEMKVYKQLPPDAPAELKERHKELIANLIKGFHQHAPRLQMRDINQYKSLADLNTAVSPLIKASEEKAAEKLKQEEGSLKLYEDADWLMIIPLTYEASCKYGANTQWCVASRDTKEHFKSYTKSGLLIYLIHKKSNNKFAFYHDYDNDGSSVEIYNPIDNDISWEYKIDGKVEIFLQGLVRGKMEEYLQEDSDDYDEEEYEIRYSNRNFWAYDFDDLVDRVTDLILRHYLGRGSGRNSFQKYKDVLGIFGLNLELQGKTQGSPFTIKDEEGSNFAPREVVFNVFARNNGINNLLHDYLYDIMENEGVEGIKRIITMASAYQPKYTNVARFQMEIIGPEFTEKKGESKEVDPNNIMTKEQAKTIFSVYEKYLGNAKEEIKKRQKEIVDKILNGVELSESEKFDKCFSMDNIYKSLNDIPQTKRILIEILRNRGLLKGRLPRNWPVTRDGSINQPRLNGGDANYIMNTCMNEVGGGNLSNYEFKFISEKGKKITKNLHWLYRELSDNGVRMNNGYQGLLRMLIDREKEMIKTKNP